ncbi:MAG: radical SAM family heme chaperone HemW [Schleiferiaceae bacterium]|nr:radical SAM family heme chaperone HemW [Schleiferiaceae bacterium]
MAGLYLHVPYCRKACHYCDFHFSTQLNTLPQMVEKLQVEAKLRSEEPHPKQTWYWGGGSPSVLPFAMAQEICDSFSNNFPLISGGEFTLEANPEDLSHEALNGWKTLGVNRLSVGIQSFVDRRLQWMNRSHSGQDARDGIRRAQDAGIASISVDLIYGLPDTSLGEWQDNVGEALALGVPHLSTYALTVEERTALHQHIRRGLSQAPKEDRAIEDFLWLRSQLREEGWEPYELSNASLPGYRSRHNSAYWSGASYVGLGPGAHSFDGTSVRRWNVSNNGQYLRQVGTSQSWFEEEQLRPEELVNEQIMTQLRRMEGLLRTSVGAYASTLDNLWSTYIAQGLMIQTANAWVLSDEGLFLSDRIAMEGFVAAGGLGTLEA